MRRPRRAYLICASQRSGSTLLCRALSDTGIAGHPDEYFRTGPAEAFPAGGAAWEDSPLARSHGVATREAFLELVYDLGSTDNGVFGAKVMWSTVPWILQKLWEVDGFAGMTPAGVFTAAFPDLQVVHLTRRDRLRQAVSWARASQDGVQVVSDDEPAVPTGKPAYDGRFIAWLVGRIKAGEQSWRALCAEIGVVPHEVAYEDLADPRKYENAVWGVLAHLGLEPQGPIPAPRTRRQADALNETWVDRFLADQEARSWSETWSTIAPSTHQPSRHRRLAPIFHGPLRWREVARTRQGPSSRAFSVLRHNEDHSGKCT
jgi:trehalose 2-sulfotransferase